MKKVKTDEEVVKQISDVIWEMKFNPDDAEHFISMHKENVNKAFLECAKVIEKIKEVLSDQYDVG